MTPDDGRASQGVTPYVLLLILCLALYLPGITAVPPIDRDESRFAQASKQMLESGDLIRIRFQDESRAKKPAGIYWLQAGSAWLTGRIGAIWAYRLPSVLGASLAVLLTFALGQRLAGAPAALIGAALLASCFLLVSEAHQAKTDAVQLMTIVAAQGALGLVYCQSRPPSLAVLLLFWLAQGAGILIKGPIVPLVSLLTALSLVLVDQSAVWLRRLRPGVGLPLVALMIGPWLWAISRATGGQFVGNAVRNDLLAKVLGAQESHGGWPGTYLLLLLATLWPASLLVVPALPVAWAARRQPVTRFLLAWIIPTWLLFEAIPTKLPHYILPVYPALTLLAGLWLTDPARPGTRRWARPVALVSGLIGTLLALLLPAAPLALQQPPAWDLLPWTLLLLALTWGATLLLLRHRAHAALPLALLAAVVGFGAAFGLLLPRLEPLWLSRRIEAALPAGAPLAAAGYHEPSLVFLHGTTTLLTDGPGAADFLLRNPDGWAAVEAAAGDDFLSRLHQAGRDPIAAGRIDGFNYSRGRPAQITLWRNHG